jgi:hypothetical protein
MEEEAAAKGRSGEESDSRTLLSPAQRYGFYSRFKGLMRFYSEQKFAGLAVTNYN